MKPFTKMLMGIGLSPSLMANVQEAARLCALLAEEIVFVHVSDGKSQEKAEIEAFFQSKIELSIPHRFIWLQGNIAELILETCSLEGADLLLVGALPREGLLRYYMGSVARQLVRKSNCSVMLLTRPQQFPKSYNHIVVSGNKHPKTADTINKAIAVAEVFESELLHIVEEIAPDKRTQRAADDTEQERSSRWRHILEAREEHRIKKSLPTNRPQALKLESKVIFGKPGYCIGHFTESNQAELLVMNSPDTKLGFLDRVFTHDLEYILSELPSDLLIVHSSESQRS